MAPKKDAKGKDAKGKDVKGKDAKGKDAKGKDVKGKDAKGKDAKGKDAKGKDVKGKDAKKKDVKGKDAKKKDAKKKDAKKKDAKGKGPKVPGGPSVLENDGAKNAGKMVCVLLTIASITLTILCDRAYHKSREVPDAMAKLRTRMAMFDKSLEEKSEEEVLEAAEAMSQHVIDRRLNITLLKRDIGTYKNRIKQGWRIYNRTFWFFTRRVTYEDMKTECLENGVKLHKIVDANLEKFLETQLEQLQSGIWVPMVKKYTSRSRYDWIWEDDNTKATSTMYWQPGEPNDMPNEHCAEIKLPCNTPNKCWNDIPCKLRNVGFCIGEPVETKWLFD